ncbi:hypothetical protein [[Leptolyngbya] sp. PCC 7376]|uniref:hypothetical protein n=1 Tax=[Leptolyngbya] sp. PCC 7376 TaxID=111781 RepID=UPI0002D7FA25|nr:hypothetical protein [[Leptolyngbya] sp. PCC 7376]
MNQQFVAWCKKTENTLIKETDFHLPGMKQLHGSEELSLTVVVMVIDATEQAIEKPEKTTSLLLREKEASFP